VSAPRRAGPQNRVPAEASAQTSPGTRKEIETFSKNQRGDFIRVSLSEYQGFRLLDVRQTFIAENGSHAGTKKGVSISVHLLDTLINALVNARTECFRSGWLRDETSRKAA
jgi:hypothetical protein